MYYFCWVHHGAGANNKCENQNPVLALICTSPLQAKHPRNHTSTEPLSAPSTRARTTGSMAALRCHPKTRQGTPFAADLRQRRILVLAPTTCGLERQPQCKQRGPRASGTASPHHPWLANQGAIFSPPDPSVQGRRPGCYPPVSWEWYPVARCLTPYVSYASYICIIHMCHLY